MLSSYFVVPLENLNHAPTPSIVLVIPGLASASDKETVHSIIHPGFVRTWKNFIPPDFHVVIPVRPGLLMVESQSVKDLMFNDGLMVAPLANGEVLSHVLVTNLRPAPSKGRETLSFRQCLSGCNSQDFRTQIRRK